MNRMTCIALITLLLENTKLFFSFVFSAVRHLQSRLFLMSSLSGWMKLKEALSQPESSAAGFKNQVLTREVMSIAYPFNAADLKNGSTVFRQLISI